MQSMGEGKLQAIAYPELTYRFRNFLCKAASLSSHTIIMYYWYYCRTYKLRFWIGPTHMQRKKEYAYTSDESHATQRLAITLSKNFIAQSKSNYYHPLQKYHKNILHVTVEQAQKGEIGIESQGGIQIFTVLHILQAGWRNAFFALQCFV